MVAATRTSSRSRTRVRPPLTTAGSSPRPRWQTDHRIRSSTRPSIAPAPDQAAGGSPEHNAGSRHLADSVCAQLPDRFMPTRCQVPALQHGPCGSGVQVTSDGAFQRRYILNPPFVQMAPATPAAACSSQYPEDRIEVKALQNPRPAQLQLEQQVTWTPRRAAAVIAAPSPSSAAGPGRPMRKSASASSGSVEANQVPEVVYPGDPAGSRRSALRPRLDGDAGALERVDINDLPFAPRHPRRSARSLLR